MVFCSGCGQQLPDSAKFCPSCGAAVSYGPAPQRPPQTSAPVRPSSRPNNQAGCRTALLLVGGILLLFVAGCAVLGFLASKIPDSTKSSSSRKASKGAYSEAALEKAGLAKLTKGLEGVNKQYGEQLFSGSASLGSSRCGAQVDGNVYEALSEQDKHIVTQIVGTLCVAAYRAPYGKSNVRSLPDGGLAIEIDDLSGNEVAHDLWYRK